MSDKNNFLYVIDRFESDFCIIEASNGDEIHMQNIHISQLPPNLHDGDVMQFNNGIWTLDVDATAQRTSKIKSTFNNLWNPPKK